MNQRVRSSQVNSGKDSLRILVLFGPLFLFAGGMVLWQLMLEPLLLLWRSQAWVATECTIISSEAERKQLSKNRAYRPKIGYRYLVNGVDQLANRYDFFEASGGRKWAQSVANAYPVGSRHACYYDPSSPQEAVLIRGFSSARFWLGPLVAAVFIAAGAFMIWAGLASSTAAVESRPALEGELASATARPVSESDSRIAGVASSLPFPDSSETVDRPGGSAGLTGIPTPYPARPDWQRFAGPQQLVPAVTRTAAAIGTFIAALFWNGLISFFVWGIIDDKAWFMLLFLTPFILIGLGLIGAFFYSVLCLFNPQVKIALSEGAPETGETIEIAWEVSGRVARIREFTIAVIGEEQATYTRGTSTLTERHPFQSLEVCRLSNSEEMRFGTASVQIPRETMHTHSGDRNKIAWSLRVRGNIPYFPNVLEQYEFHVLPRGVR